MNILVTGGLGFIGSITSLKLLEAGYEVVIVDNLSNSKITTLEKLEKLIGKEILFYKVDVTDIKSLEEVFKKHKIEAVFHFSGLKAVGESVEKPLLYYRNNVLGTINLTEMALKYNVNNFVFSSSATVYGDGVSPLKEDMELKPRSNPYGETKVMSEQILIDSSKANSSLKVALLRYFNPIGADESGLLGEDPKGIPNNLMPYVSKVAKGELKELSVFGNDYPTVDGSGVRDYIHVVDLALGHIAALKNLKNGVAIYNLGTGKGVSVLELVNTFEKVNKIKVPYKITTRRPGDLAIAYADVSKAKQELNWETTKTLEEMVKDAWNFEQKNK